MVTVTGPAGVGKTRLAIEAARACRLPDGAWFADLAAERDAGLLAHGVSAALGVGDQARPAAAGGARRAARRQAHAARPRHLRAPARLLPRARRGDPRRRARGAHPRHQPVPARPAGGAGPPAGAARRAAARGRAARAVRRGPAARPARRGARRAAARGAAGDRRALGELARRLDGIPFALELAARRLRTVSAGELAERPGDVFTLLGDDPGRIADGAAPLAAHRGRAGATSCAPARSGCCGPGCRCSPAASTSAPRSPCAPTSGSPTPPGRSPG